MQVLAAEDFDIKHSLSQVALVRQVVVGWVGAAVSELRQDASPAQGLCAGGSTSGAS